MVTVHMSENPQDNPLTCIPHAVICCNNTNNKTHGCTPYDLIFGNTLRDHPKPYIMKQKLFENIYETEIIKHKRPKQ